MSVDLVQACIAVGVVFAAAAYALSIARRRIAALTRQVEALQVASAQRTLADRQRRSQAGIKGHETRRQRRLGMPLPITENGGAE